MVGTMCILNEYNDKKYTGWDALPSSIRLIISKIIS